MRTIIFATVIIICAIFLLYAQLQIDRAKELNTIIPTQIVLTYNKNSANSFLAPMDVKKFVKILNPIGGELDFIVDRVDKNSNFDLPGMIYITVRGAKESKMPYKMELINVDGQFDNSVIKVRSNDPKSMIDEITYKPLQSGPITFMLPITGAVRKF